MLPRSCQPVTLQNYTDIPSGLDISRRASAPYFSCKTRSYAHSPTRSSEVGNNHNSWGRKQWESSERDRAGSYRGLNKLAGRKIFKKKITIHTNKCLLHVCIKKTNKKTEELGVSVRVYNNVLFIFITWVKLKQNTVKTQNVFTIGYQYNAVSLWLLIYHMCIYLFQ